MAVLLAEGQIDLVVRGLVVRSGCRVTLHTAGKGVCFPGHNASCTRRWPRRGATHLTRGGPRSPLTKTVALPVSPPAMRSPAAILSVYAVVSAAALIATPSGTIPVST